MGGACGCNVGVLWGVHVGAMWVCCGGVHVGACGVYSFLLKLSNFKLVFDLPWGTPQEGLKSGY